MDNIALQYVDFVRSDGKFDAGLAPVHERGETWTTLSIDEKAAVIDSELFERIDFVYFRRFSDGRSSQVAAYVVDNSDEKLNEKALAELHLKVWLQGRTPLLYIAWASRVDVLTCAREPDFWNEEAQAYRYNPAKILKTAGGISSEMQKFSALRLADGTFWEDPRSSKLANHNKAAHQSLIQAVVEADKDLDGSNNPVLRRLLLLMVLVKYLEDRKVFPNDGWFGRFHKGARNFFDVLKGGIPDEVDRLLKFLEVKFNGDVFDLSRLPQRRLTKTNLKTFADLVEARTLKAQRYLWEQFSFEHLPVEIISHLYQRFVKDGHGAVYTPPFLAALLLDHAMPYDKLTGDERILDPACGSAVFLVGAFRRLVNVWRSRNSWKRPKVEELKNILGQSIYGIDLDSNAIDLAAFSLSLAICDALKPVDIWEKLKFDYLRDSNLFEADFFRVVLDAKQGDSTLLHKYFDIVIGNPPFESNLTEAGKEIDQLAQLQDSTRGKCPDNQSAYLFLEQALHLLRSKGPVCLIQPVGFLYNKNVKTFRSKIFQNYQVDTVLDFTSIRNLYESDVKTVAVLAHNRQPAKDHWIAHWTFRRTVSVHQRICFELDHYDRQRILQKDAQDNPHVWRVNLLGGGRLLHISKRLRSMRTLKEYVNQKGWDYGEGFIVGNRKTSAPFLKDKDFLPAEALTPTGIDDGRIKRVPWTCWERPRRKENYTPPLVLIRKLESLPIDFWDRDFLAYPNSIVGIHAPPSQASELRKFYNFFHDKHGMYKFSSILNGGEFSATAYCKQRIDELPHPDDLKEYSFSFWEGALCKDVVIYMTEYIRLGQNSELLQRKAEVVDLRKYSSIFIKMLGSVYDNLQARDPVFLNGLTCQAFYFGPTPKPSWLDEDAESELKKLVYYKNHEHLRTIRVFRLYAENVMLIVKPDRLRYWIPSTAIRDADETLIDLHERGY